MSRAASRRAPSPLSSAASSYPHQSAAGQIAALGKSFMGFRGSHAVGKEDGKCLDMIREEHMGVGSCRQPHQSPFGFLGVSSSSSLCLLSACLSPRGGRRLQTQLYSCWEDMLP